MATAGVAPRIMGFGPAPAVKKLLAADRPALAQMDVIELNEAFAAQGLAVTRDLGLPTTIPASIPTAAPSPSATRSA
jgi:acetyl-CoA acyltransferase